MPPVFYSVSTGPASPDDPGKLCVPSCFRFLLIRTFVQDRVAYEVFIVAHFVFLVKIFEKIRFWLFASHFLLDPALCVLSAQRSGILLRRSPFVKGFSGPIWKLVLRFFLPGVVRQFLFLSNEA